MRDYSQIVPTFWTRGSGKELRGDHLAMLVALYAMTCPSSTMIGIYYLPLPTLAHEVGSDIEGARKALRRVEDVGIVQYDEETETIWVPEMARYQIGETLAPRDNRKAAVIKALTQLGKHRFARAFYAKYKASYGLPEMPELASAETNAREAGRLRKGPSEAPSEPLGSQEQEQEQVHTHCADVRGSGPGADRGRVGKASRTAPLSLPSLAKASDEPVSPEARRILARIREHASIAPAATAKLAEAIEGRRMGRGTPVEVLLEAIGECARDAATQAAVGAPWDVFRIAEQLGRYCDSAGRRYRPPRPGARVRGGSLGDAGRPPVQPQAKPGEYDWREGAEERRVAKLRELEELAAAAGGGG